MSAFSVYTMFWLVLLLLAIANGLARETIFAKHLSELQAHQLSSLTAMILFGGAVWLLSLWNRPQSVQESVGIGATWLVLTVTFEFVFGRFVVGHSWQRLFQDYNLLAGRVWLIVLLWTFLLPYIVFKIHESPF